MPHTLPTEETTMATKTRKTPTAPLPLSPDGKSLAIDRKDTVHDVTMKLSLVLNREGLVDEYFSTSPLQYVDKDHADACWQARDRGEPEPARPAVRPGAKWTEIGYWGIAVYPMTGGSEGVYVHVDIIGHRGEHPKFPAGSGYYETTSERNPLCFVKTWTWESAWKITHRLVELLEA
jgi:hypothetical protein